MLMCVMGGLDTLNTSAPSAETVMKLLSSQYRCDLHQTPQQITATQTKAHQRSKKHIPEHYITRSFPERTGQAHQLDATARRTQTLQTQAVQ